MNNAPYPQEGIAPKITFCNPPNAANETSLAELSLNDFIDKLEKIPEPSFKRYPNGEIKVFSELFITKEVSIE